jgi:hypothetical protein
MRPMRIVAGGLVALSGGVWVLQGLNVAFAPRSFMTAQTVWVIIGLLAVIAGLALAASGRRRG